MNNALRILLRLITLVLAVSAALIMLGGGLWYVWQTSRGNAPQLRYTVTGESVERLVLTAYLRARAGDVEHPANPLDGHEVVFVVETGQSLDQVAKSLEALGLISEADLFVRLVQFMGADQDIQAGVFTLRPNMTMEEITLELQHARLPSVPVTIPEGWRAEEIAFELEASGVISREVFLAAVRRGNPDLEPLTGRLLTGTTSLEGYLFPDTYQFPLDTTPERVLGIFLQNWDRRVPQELREKAAQTGMSLHQVVTLASIVEREAMQPDERPTIASVYFNRMRQGMYLQADPTVQYAKGYDAKTQKWWGPMTMEDYARVQSPYSTYLNPGLPPGPICNPGLESIKAVLEPAKSDYLYYYAKASGSHVFAKTYEEHLRNIQTYGLR